MYKTNHTSAIKSQIRLLMGLGIVCSATVTLAADLDISRQPLFLESGVQPNIMFIVDDSGSMNWETLNSLGARDNFAFLPENDSTVDVTPSISADDRNEILQACSGANVLYYDPKKTYTPWVGLDQSGTAYVNAPINAAKNNPFANTTGTLDLTDSDGSGDKTGFFPWFDHDSDGYLDEYVDIDGDGNLDAFLDQNGNGVFDGWVDIADSDGNFNGIYDGWVDVNGDGDYDVGEFEFESELECADSDDLTLAQMRTWFVSTDEFVDMSGITTAQKEAGYLPLTVAEQKTNFANWYSFYRKREYVAKRSISSIVSSSSARVGLKTLHNNNTVYTSIEDVDNLSTPVSSIAQTNKEKLLKNVFKITSKSGTPLRKTLEDVGTYFKKKDGTGPILSAALGGSCQQNFAILMTDGVWNGNDPSVGNADSDTESPFDGGLYADRETGVKNTLADVAMYYYKNDLRDDLDNKVPLMDGIDENNKQHLVTYTVAFGVTGTLDGSIEPDENDDKWLGWPTPNNNANTTIDDVRHAAYNGRGIFLSASDPESLIDSLDAAISDIDSRDGSASAVSVNTGSISSDTMIFQAEFNSNQWSGKLNGIRVNLDGTIVDSKESGSIVPAWNQRTIITFDGTAGTDVDGDGVVDGDGIPFTWDNLNTAQKSSLDGSSDMLEYLRGNQNKEGTISTDYRVRTLLTKLVGVGAAAVAIPVPGADSPLGDIVNSSPVYVAEPEYLYADSFESIPYSDFRAEPTGTSYSTKYSREPMIYVGSNDGMLHGFNADATNSATLGQERMAYVPSMLIDVLPDLASQNYLHSFYADGSPSVGDAFFDGGWNTVLVSGLNSGGQGIFALNVTDPSNWDTELKAKDQVLWEFSDQDDADLGYTYSKPVIVKANNGKWVAIFGNGYNNTVDDGTEGSGTAVLYVVDVQTGVLIRKIDTKVNDLGTPNGLSSPAVVDTNGDYKTDYVYAGDLEGNMWKFDLSSTDPSNWDVTFKSGTTNLPLYTSCVTKTCSTSNRQPITVQPKIGRNIGSSGYIVYFGTGTYFLGNDNSSTSLQSFYAIWDRGEATLSQFTKYHLLEQKILEDDIAIYNQGILANYARQVSQFEIIWHPKSASTTLPTDGTDSDNLVDTHLGWHMDLVDSSTGTERGERAVSSPVLRDDSVIFVTTIPNADPCSSGGESWYMELQALSGRSHEDPVIDINNDGVLDEHDKVGTSGSETSAGGVRIPDGGIATAPVCITLQNGLETCKSNTSTAGLLEVTRDAGIALGRWMWREL